MKIGIDARFFGTPGKGLGRYTEKLVRALEELDVENTYEILLYGESFDDYQPKNSRFTKIKVPYRWYGFAEQFLYPFFLWSRRYDLMHFPHFNVPLLYRRPFVVTIHDLILLHYPTHKASTHRSFWYGLKYFFYLQVIQSAIRRAKMVLTVSRFTRGDVVSEYPGAEGKMVVTLEGVEQSCLWLPPRERAEVREECFRRVGKNPNVPYTLYVGNSYPHKNLSVFLELAQAEPNVDIVLVGRQDYFYERFQKEKEQAGVSNIYLIGGVSDEHLAVLYQGARAYVFPSLYEGFGLPPLEAMQYQVPVLVSNRGSLPEIVGEAALIADPDEKTDFMSQYHKLLYEESTREKLQQLGVKRATQFSWREMAEATKDVYNRVIKA